nr:hypothetical protein [Tanacetum cinerariifolium]
MKDLFLLDWLATTTSPLRKAMVALIMSSTDLGMLSFIRLLGLGLVIPCMNLDILRHFGAPFTCKLSALKRSMNVSVGSTSLCLISTKLSMLSRGSSSNHNLGAPIKVELNMCHHVGITYCSTLAVVWKFFRWSSGHPKTLWEHGVTDARAEQIRFFTFVRLWQFIIIRLEILRLDSDVDLLLIKSSIVSLTAGRDPSIGLRRESKFLVRESKLWSRSSVGPGPTLLPSRVAGLTGHALAPMKDLFLLDWLATTTSPLRKAMVALIMSSTDLGMLSFIRLLGLGLVIPCMNLDILRHFGAPFTCKLSALKRSMNVSVGSTSLCLISTKLSMLSRGSSSNHNLGLDIARHPKTLWEHGVTDARAEQIRFFTFVRLWQFIIIRLEILRLDSDVDLLLIKSSIVSLTAGRDPSIGLRRESSNPRIFLGFRGYGRGPVLVLARRCFRRGSLGLPDMR